MNLPMSFTFDITRHDKRDMLAVFDRCYEKGMKLIVCDSRTHFRTYQKLGAKHFRKGVESAGYPLYLIANIAFGYRHFKEETFEKYSDVFDRVYAFLAPGFTGIRAEEFHMRSYKVCNKLGKSYMPTLWPAYYGAWNGGRNDFYQPYYGVDMIHENFLGAKKSFTDWVHITTWNDHDETTLMARRLSPAVKQLVKSYSDELKGIESDSSKPDFIIAYHREVFPGTVWRIEAMRLPSKDTNSVKLECRLLNANDGSEIKCLNNLEFKGEAWERKEWIIDTSTLLENAEIRPQITMKSPSLSIRRSFPSLFFVSPYLHNPETVRVSFNSCPSLEKCDFSTEWKNGRLNSSINFSCDREVKRAILFKDDLPIAQFRPNWDESKKLLHLLVRGNGSFTLKTDATILTASRQFNLGKKKFKWDSHKCSSYQQLSWSPSSMEILGEDNSTIEIKVEKEILRTTINELVEAKTTKIGKLSIETDTNASIYQHRPLSTKSASLQLSLASTKPEKWSRYWVQLECTDGTTAESQILHPVQNKNQVIFSQILKTPFNLDTKSGGSGIPKMREFLTPQDEMPVKKEEIVKEKINTAIYKNYAWTNKENTASFRLPLRQWPSGAYEIKFIFTPKEVEKGKKAHPIKTSGTMDGISVNLLDDGRLEIIRTSGEKKEGGVVEKLISKSPIKFGSPNEIKIRSTFEKLLLYINGIEDSSIPLTPQIRYGNSTTTLNNIDYLEFKGI
jgi:hypothetical protein